MTREGGNAGGTMFSTDINGENHQIQYNFFSVAGKTPQLTHLTEASNGKLYGMTWKGGVYDKGVIFEYDPVTNRSYKKLDFNGELNGANPYGSLVVANNGKLFGMTFSGGIFDEGVIFEYNPVLNILVKKIDFDGTSKGGGPYGNLLQISNGKMYGMTETGGANDKGVLFEYNPTTNIYQKKLDFDGVLKGAIPRGSLMQTSDGRIFGMTRGGGINNHGVLFEYNPTNNIFTKKLDFNDSATGLGPYGNLMQASNGKLYGLTASGGSSATGFGVLFEYNYLTDTFSKKMVFDKVNTGSGPFGTLLEIGTGELYGMTSSGGTSNGSYGTLFMYNFNTNILTKKMDFFGSEAVPRGSLMKASNGKIYGLTSAGGSAGQGLLFEYDFLNNKLKNRLDFQGTSEGYNPYGSLVQANNGKLYGMTLRGTGNGKGVLFEYDLATKIYKRKKSFDGSLLGDSPYGSLIQITTGKLYGMTSDGGANFKGTLFEYDIATDVLTRKADFNGAERGKTPFGTPMQASNGKIYGMASAGGTSDFGVLFEYDPIAKIFAKKIDFDGLNGQKPYGNLIEASNGKLYGMTLNGGTNNFGVLFEYDKSSGVLTKKIDFDGANNGKLPYASLVKGTQNKIYGMTSAGGISDFGVLFEFDIATNQYRKITDFDGALNGKNPLGSLTLSSNGKLYGMTSDGGSYNSGTLFEYNPANQTFTKKMDFTELNGKKPFYGQLTEITNNSLGIDATQISEKEILFYPNPVTEKLFLVKNDFISYEIYNTAGQKLMAKSENNVSSIDMSLLTKGVYILKLKSKSGKISSLKIIKN